MTTLTEAKTGEELVAEDLENSEVATELERTRHQPTGHPGDRYRVGHGLTQSALARRLGISQPAVARLESGDRRAIVGHPWCGCQPSWASRSASTSALAPWLLVSA